MENLIGRYRKSIGRARDFEIKEVNTAHQTFTGNVFMGSRKLAMSGRYQMKKGTESNLFVWFSFSDAFVESFVLVSQDSSLKKLSGMAMLHFQDYSDIPSEITVIK